MQVDTVIVGAGPGGLAAARAAKRVGKRVLVIDDNWGPGGQIWRGRAGLIVEGVEFQFGRQLASLDVDYGQLILACGARELFLPFPGWTLPHVLGAGGLQALVKTGLHIQGKRVVVAGSGPLLLAVAANLNTAGATVVLVAEQASWGSLMRFGLGLWRWPAKIVQAFELASWNYRAGLWPVEASAGAVKMSDGRTWECDYVACGFGLVPNVELALLAGCRLRDGFVAVDEYQKTSVDGVYAIGELTGIGGVEKAEAEGEAAGSGQRLQGNHAGFVRTLRECFALRPELKDLVRADTVVCRCEDVRYGQLQGYRSRREAKLQTRCGMGPCQARVCGPAVEFLLGWEADRVRPPVLPVRVKDLIGASEKATSLPGGEARCD